MSVTDGFTLEGPVGEFVLAGLAFGAQLERVAGEDRRAAAREKREAAGLPFGRPPEVTPELHAQILALSAAGKSSRKIAQSVKVPASTVRDWLKKPLASERKVTAERGPAAPSELAPSVGGER